MGNEDAVGMESGGDMNSMDWIDSQFGTVEMLHLGFLQGFAEDPLATFTVIALGLFVLGVSCRYIIYLITRLSGRTRVEPLSDAAENAFLWGAFAAGFLAGEVFFRNAFLSALTGGFFVVICIGAVLEGVVANTASRRAAARR